MAAAEKPRAPLRRIPASPSRRLLSIRCPSLKGLAKYTGTVATGSPGQLEGHGDAAAWESAFLAFVLRQRAPAARRLPSSPPLRNTSEAWPRRAGSRCVWTWPGVQRPRSAGLSSPLHGPHGEAGLPTGALGAPSGLSHSTCSRGHTGGEGPLRLSLIRRAKRGEAAVTRSRGKQRLASGGGGGRPRLQSQPADL